MILALLVILTSCSANALTLPEALVKALQFSPAVKKTEASKAVSEHEISKARAALFPTINAVGTAETKQNSKTASTSTISSYSPTNSETWLLGVELSQPLYTGGAITSGLGYYRTGDAIARENYRIQKQNTASDIVKAYYGFAKNFSRLQLAKENRDILKAYLDITARYQKIGRVKKTDYMQARVNYLQSLADIESIESELSKSRITLTELIGESAPAAPDFKLVVPNVEFPSLAKSEQTALENNPQIKVYDLQLEQVDYSRGLDLSTDMPSLKLTGSAGYTSSDKATLTDDTSRYYKVGLNLTIPLFSGLSSMAKRGIYTEKTIQAERDLDIQKSKLRETLRAALESLRSGEAQLKILEDAANESRSALVLANRGYEQGIVSSQDVVTLQRSRYETEKLLMSGQFSFLQSLLDLRLAMGIDLEKAYGK